MSRNFCQKLLSGVCGEIGLSISFNIRDVVLFIRTLDRTLSPQAIPATRLVVTLVLMTAALDDSSAKITPSPLNLLICLVESPL